MYVRRYRNPKMIEQYERGENMDAQETNVISSLEADLLQFGRDGFKHLLRCRMTDARKRVVRGLVECIYGIQGKTDTHLKKMTFASEKRGIGLSTWLMITSLWMRVQLDAMEMDDVAVHLHTSISPQSVDLAYANNFSDKQFRRWYRDRLLVIGDREEPSFSIPSSIQSAIVFTEVFLNGSVAGSVEVACEKSCWAPTEEDFRKIIENV